MSRVCEICGKGPKSGNNISHSHRVTKRRFLPNTQDKRVFNEEKGIMEKKRICTSCIRTQSKRAA